MKALPGLLLATTLPALCLSLPATAGMPTTVYVSSSVVCDYPDIQAAISDLAPGSEIRLVGAEFLLPASLNLFNRQLRIAGGYPACGAPAPTGKSTLRADFGAAPVLLVGGNLPGALNLELRDLVVTGGDNPTGNGGGLQVTGIGQVNLVGVDVHGNVADSGGGMYVQSLLGGPLAVNLIGGTRVGTEEGLGNSARLGGGVTCFDARMRLGHADIMSNSAEDRGGGLFAGTCEILSTDAVGDLRIEANRANEGAGIHAANQSQLTLRSRPQQRISISRNEAVLGTNPRGGGISLVSAGTRLEGSGLRIDDNIARGFAAGVRVVGSEMLLDRGVDSCAPSDLACASLSGNQVVDETGMPSGSAAAAFVAGAGSPLLTLRQVRIAGNLASSGILGSGDAAALVLDSALLVGNQSNQSLVRINSESTLEADFLTIADNLLGGAIFSNTSTAPLALSLRRSIVLADGGTHLSGAGSTAFSCLNTGAGGALGGTTHAAGFFDAAAGQYRLHSDSANLDQCAVDGTESPFDYAGRPRIVDRAGVPNGAGPVDRGAFEDPEDLFADGAED